MQPESESLPLASGGFPPSKSRRLGSWEPSQDATTGTDTHEHKGMVRWARGMRKCLYHTSAPPLTTDEAIGRAFTYAQALLEKLPAVATNAWGGEAIVAADLCRLRAS